jgi:hypothetical protein
LDYQTLTEAIKVSNSKKKSPTKRTFAKLATGVFAGRGKIKAEETKEDDDSRMEQKSCFNL